jgi:hypothetical protein
MPSEGAFAPSIAGSAVLFCSPGLLSRQKDPVMNKARNVPGNYCDFPMCVFLADRVKSRLEGIPCADSHSIGSCHHLEAGCGKGLRDEGRLKLEIHYASH